MNLSKLTSWNSEELNKTKMKELDFSNYKVLIVGDVMLDKYYFGQVERISPEAPVPIVNIRKEESRLGGASNVANNIASLGGTNPIMRHNWP